VSETHEEATQPRSLRVEVAPRTLVAIAGAIALVWLLGLLWNVVIIVTIALVLVGTLDPMVAWLERRGLGRGRSLALILFLLVLVFAGIVLATVPPLLSQLQHIVEDAPKERNRIAEFFDSYKSGAPFAKAVRSVPLDDVVVKAGNEMLSYSTYVLAALGYALTTMFLAIYLLADPRHAKSAVFAVMPRNHHVKLARILKQLSVIVGGYMRGQLITSVAIGVFMFATMSALRVDDALAIAVFAALTDIIPFVGGYLASGPAVLAVAGRGTPTIILVVALMVLYQEFESRILVPRVYGRVLRMSPATVLVALLIGGTLMGIIGALLALPIAAGLRLVVREMRVDLPGEAPDDKQHERAADAHQEHLYEHLAEGAPLDEAAEIAGKVAAGKTKVTGRHIRH
jgi:predicted PurR-regulated permease PerM